MQLLLNSCLALVVDISLKRVCRTAVFTVAILTLFSLQRRVNGKSAVLVTEQELKLSLDTKPRFGARGL